MGLFPILDAHILYARQKYLKKSNLTCVVPLPDPIKRCAWPDGKDSTWLYSQHYRLKGKQKCRISWLENAKEKRNRNRDRNTTVELYSAFHLRFTQCQISEGCRSPEYSQALPPCGRMYWIHPWDPWDSRVSIWLGDVMMWRNQIMSGKHECVWLHTVSFVVGDVQHRIPGLSCTRRVTDVTILAWDNPYFFPLRLAIGASHTWHLWDS